MDIGKYEMGLLHKRTVNAVASLGFEKADVEFTNTSLYTVFPIAARHRRPSFLQTSESSCSPSALRTAARSMTVRPAAPIQCRSCETTVIANATLVGDLVKENETEAALTAV